MVSFFAPHRLPCGLLSVWGKPPSSVPKSWRLLWQVFRLSKTITIDGAVPAVASNGDRCGFKAASANSGGRVATD